MIDTNILKNEEKAAFSLRTLYSRFGYERYKMSKFEEYDLYVKNKDFLVSEGIITFTDTNGRLLALKPDVTLSIIKNTKDIKGYVQKVYYDENVYRISKDSHSYKEIAQTGLECIGDIGINDVCQVLYLALKSLESISREHIMEISHAGLINALSELFGIDKDLEEQLLSLVKDKNRDGAAAFCQSINASEELHCALLLLMESYRSIEKLEQALSPFLSHKKVQEAFSELKAVYSCLSSFSEENKLLIDFSIVSDVNYYSGIVFKGYIKGVPSSVLSGGRYDKLMKKMGKNGGAIGFAVYLDMLARLENRAEDFDCDTLLLASEKANPVDVIRKAEELSAKGERVMTVKSISPSLKYKKIVKFGFEEDDDNA